MNNDPPPPPHLDVANRDDESPASMPDSIIADHAKPVDGHLTEPPIQPMPNPGMDEELNEELAKLFEERFNKDKRKARRSRILKLCSLLAIVAGGGWWFVSNPDHIDDVQQMISQIRATINPGAVSESYQESLDRMASRNDEIRNATELLGASEDGPGDGDPE